MCNKPVMDAIKGGFGIFSMNAGRMLPPIVMVGGLYVVWALVEPMASVGILSMAMSLFFILCIAGVHVEFIQSLMNDKAPSLNPIKMIYRMEVVKLFVTKLLASIVIMMILMAMFAGLMMFLGTMGEHSIEMKMLISSVVLLFAGFFMYAKIAYLPIQISLENKVSMCEVFKKSKGLSLDLMLVLFIAVIPVLILVMMTMSMHTEIVEKVPALKVVMDTVHIFNFLPHPLTEPMKLLIAFLTGVLELIPFAAVCFFFKSRP